MELAFDIGAIVATATLAGAMAFFSAIMAPLIFIKLEAGTAGKFIRGVFPVYYLVVFVLSAVAAGFLFASHGLNLDAALMAAVAVGTLVARQGLMPRINALRDNMLEGDAAAEQLFNTLHRLSVWINGAQLIAVYAVLVRFSL